jgi:hypothetical protein
MTLTVDVSRTGANPFARFNWDEAARIWAGEAAPLGQGMLRASAPFRTGALRQDIRFRKEQSPGLMTVVYYATVPQARWVIDGTRPHPILPRNAKVLRWLGPGGMGVHYSKRVMHPGTKPNNFPERAIKPIGNAISLMFARAVKESVEL